ncbi:MAG: MBL fold metallo-hydrolase [Phycisphaerae bacterium]
MKVLQLIDRAALDPNVYTGNVHLVLGSSNALEDVNTLVDVGMDPTIVERIAKIMTGVGKTPVEQVVLTHQHFDHVGMLQAVRKTWRPRVYAFSPMDGVDKLVRHRQILRIGDRDFEVLHTPGHSHDSICLYCEQDGVLFCGDTPLLIQTGGASYEDDFVRALEHLATLNIETVYFGHGPPLTGGVTERIRHSLANVTGTRRHGNVRPALATAGHEGHVAEAGLPGQ